MHQQEQEKKNKT